MPVEVDLVSWHAVAGIELAGGADVRIVLCCVQAVACWLYAKGATQKPVEAQP